MPPCLEMPTSNEVAERASRAGYELPPNVEYMFNSRSARLPYIKFRSVDEEEYKMIARRSLNGNMLLKQLLPHTFS